MVGRMLHGCGTGRLSRKRGLVGRLFAVADCRIGSCGSVFVVSQEGYTTRSWGAVAWQLMRNTPETPDPDRRPQRIDASYRVLKDPWAQG